MNLKFFILILIILLLNLPNVIAEENEYGVVEAWFDETNATLKTVEGIKLKIGEPIEIKVTIISKISGNIYIKLKEPGVTKAYDILSGPSKQDDRIDNLNVVSGWSKTYAWELVPNGAWKNGNAPINIFVSFSKKGDQKPIEFTIANPYILDEQYTGATRTPSPTGTAPGMTPPKAAPFPSALGVIAMLLGVWMWMRRDES